MDSSKKAVVEPTPIDIEFPDEPLLNMTVSVGACRLRITPADDGSKWATGSYEDPTGSLPYEVSRKGGSVKIKQHHGLGTLKSPFSGAPTMNLELGRAKPYSLIIESGASESSIDLGGLPLTLLAIKKGAGRAELDFSRPNPKEMDKLDIDAGAVSLVMRNLANANFAEMSLDGGAAMYELDFSGELKRAGGVRLNAGVSTLKVSVPGATPAKITPGSVLGSLDIGDGLTKKEGAFWTESAVRGETPVLSISASVALGTLVLKIT